MRFRLTLLLLGALSMAATAFPAEAASRPASRPSLSASSQRVVAADSQATSRTLDRSLRDLEARWNQIPEDIQRSEPKAPPPPHEVGFYNPKTRKNEKAMVVDRVFALKHAAPVPVQEALRQILTPGLCFITYDEVHAELTVTDRPAAMDVAALLIRAMDTPLPALFFKVPPQNAAAAESELHSHLTSAGKLTALGAGAFVLSDMIEALDNASWAFNKSNLRYPPGALKTRDVQWRTTPREFPSFPRQAPLRIDAPYGGKIVAVERRTFPILYASPSEAIDAAQKVVTRGLGRVTYDASHNLLTVIDQPDVLVRLDSYLRVFDTAKHARLFALRGPGAEKEKKSIQEVLSPDAEMIPFDNDGVLIVRDTEANLKRLDSRTRSGSFLHSMPASQAARLATRPIHGPIPLSEIMPASRPASDSQPAGN